MRRDRATEERPDTKDFLSIYTPVYLYNSIPGAEPSTHFIYVQQRAEDPKFTHAEDASGRHWTKTPAHSYMMTYHFRNTTPFIKVYSLPSRKVPFFSRLD
jgi:hypothetical protein